MLPISANQIRRLRAAVRRRLLPWFAAHARRLPWRTRRRDPYAVWISEVMLQQTRVETVRPYYRRFLGRFPTVEALARASREEVLKHWEGLGYYARARQLHRAARLIVENHGGRLPSDPRQLAALPGFGPYTTAAVASLAFDQPLAVVDGNILRVLSRLIAFPHNIRLGKSRAFLQRLAQTLLPRRRPGRANEAWMELGALICTPRRPRCEACPLRSVCSADRTGNPLAFPIRPPRRPLPHKVVGAAVVLDSNDRILIAQRHPEKGMLAGLWEFPGGKVAPGERLPECIRRELREELGITVEVGPPLVTIHHAYTHFTIELHAYFARILRGRPRHLDCANHAWVRREEFDRYAFSTADHGIIRALRALPVPPRRDTLFPPQ